VIRFVFMALLVWGKLAAVPVSLAEQGGVVNLAPESRYLMETNRSFSPATILGELPHFKHAKDNIYNFGFVEKPIWIAFDVTFPPEGEPHWILRIDNPHIDEYMLYRVDGGRLTEVAHNGDTILHEKMHECRTFWEPLVPAEGSIGGDATYLLHIHTKGALQIPLTAETLSKAYDGESASNLLFGLYYGVLILLLVYNMVLYIVVREIHYFNYLLFLGSYMLFQLNFDGIGREWLWPGSVWMANSGLAFFIFLSALFAFRFARYFLMLRKYAPRSEVVLLFAEGVSFLGLAVSLLLDYHVAITLAALWSSVTPWVLIYVGCKVLPHYRAARYYLLGWIVFLLATILVALNKLGLVPTYPAILYTQQVGSLIQMILLSFALADRINMMKFDHMRKLREFNEELQETIAKKVDELRQKDRIMIQQSRQAAMGEMIENIAHQWRQPLNQLSLLQSNIFFEHELGTLSEEKMQTYQEQAESLMEYMTRTIDDFRNFFMPDREMAPFCICSGIEGALELLKPTLNRYHIQTHLTCESRPTVVGHENEFSQVVINIINNAKDAMLEHRTAKPEIAIRVTQYNGTTQVYICDNGGGVDEAIIDRIFDPYFTTKFQSQGTGIGLYMVKMIMEKSMKGRVSVANGRDGACFLLELPEADSHAQ
jgi:two-component system, sensor histidine kinase LadS